MIGQKFRDGQKRKKVEKEEVKIDKEGVEIQRGSELDKKEKEWERLRGGRWGSCTVRGIGISTGNGRASKTLYPSSRPRIFLASFQ